MSVVPLRTVRKHEETYLPADFKLTDALRAWARAKGITRLDDRFDHFTDLALAKGYKYLSWEAAFRNACRQDWARLGTEGNSAVKSCAKCGNPLTGGYTQTQQGLLCNPCWSKR